MSLKDIKASLKDDLSVIEGRLNVIERELDDDMKIHRIDVRILEFLKTGEKHTKEILDALSDERKNSVKKRLYLLKKSGKIEMPERSLYRIAPENSSDTVSSPLFLEQLRAAADNEKTIDTLLNLYDDHLKAYKEWAALNIGSGTDFEKQLAFIENFRTLTMIVDRLMKRWALVHQGYDTNTRQAQEDAKAKIEERQKEALKDAPLEDQIVVVGHYKEGMSEIFEHLPHKHLDNVSGEEHDPET